MKKILAKRIISGLLLGLLIPPMPASIHAKSASCEAELLAYLNLPAFRASLEANLFSGKNLSTISDIQFELTELRIHLEKARNRSLAALRDTPILHMSPLDKYSHPLQGKNRLPELEAALNRLFDKYLALIARMSGNPKDFKYHHWVKLSELVPHLIMDSFSLESKKQYPHSHLQFPLSLQHDRDQPEYWMEKWKKKENGLEDPEFDQENYDIPELKGKENIRTVAQETGWIAVPTTRRQSIDQVNEWMAHGLMPIMFTAHERSTYLDGAMLGAEDLPLHDKVHIRRLLNRKAKWETGLSITPQEYYSQFTLWGNTRKGRRFSPKLLHLLWFYVYHEKPTGRYGPESLIKIVSDRNALKEVLERVNRKNDFREIFEPSLPTEEEIQRHADFLVEFAEKTKTDFK